MWRSLNLAVTSLHKIFHRLDFRTTIDNENNSPSYLPLSTVNHISYNRSKLSNKKVNVI